MIGKIEYWFRLKFYYFCISKLNFFYKKKVQYNYKFKTLKKILDNKKIILIGNANINYKKINFKKYDIIIRINILPKNRNLSPNNKTDILMLQGSGGTHWVLEQKVIKIWLHNDSAFYTNYARGVIYHYPKIWEKKLSKKLSKKLDTVPSAGVRCLDFLVRIIKKPHISMYGFTFSEVSWYNRIMKSKKNTKKHNFDSEKKFTYNIIKKHKNINLYKI